MRRIRDENQIRFHTGVLVGLAWLVSLELSGAAITRALCNYANCGEIEAEEGSDRVPNRNRWRP